MINLRLTAAGVARTRFACSPLAELAESLYLLMAPTTPGVHRRWAEAAKPALTGGRLGLLAAVVPARPYVARFFFDAPSGPATTLDQQLRYLAELPPDDLRRELEAVWRGDAMPPHARALIAAGPAGPKRLAEVLGDYWCAAIEPSWPAISATLADDIQHRAAQLAGGGLEAMLGALHPKVGVTDDTLQVRIDRTVRRDLTGTGLLLMPSVFIWPNVSFGHKPGQPPVLTYPARGVGNLWGTGRHTRDDDPLGSLLGRTRAAILRRLDTPRSTSELAAELGQSMPAVSQHLAVLRRNGLARSWRSGRHVMYRRTDLATNVVEARHVPPVQTTTGAAPTQDLPCPPPDPGRFTVPRVAPVSAPLRAGREAERHAGRYLPNPEPWESTPRGHVTVPAPPD